MHCTAKGNFSKIEFVLVSLSMQLDCLKGNVALYNYANIHKY